MWVSAVKKDVLLMYDLGFPTHAIDTVNNLSSDITSLR